ncbi:MAG: hypothetical protein KBG28_27670, partial [Kofleriaceae bacterium]|nr:hypothetical protein [Kofleriaceae bacterium]
MYRMARIVSTNEAIGPPRATWPFVTPRPATFGGVVRLDAFGAPDCATREKFSRFPLNALHAEGSGEPGKWLGACFGVAPMSDVETIRYDEDIVRKFVTATILWGVV